jgi:hypothetical protein
VAADNLRSPFRVIVRGRKRLLGRQPVLHGNHPAAAFIRQLAQLFIVGGEAAADKTAAVIVDNGWQRTGSILRRYHAKIDPFQRDVVHLHTRFAFSGQHRTGYIARPPVINILLS